MLPAHGLAQDAEEEAKLLHPLAERSPFLPSDFSPPEERRTAPQRQNQEALSNRYEFRGVYQLDGEYRFLISEKRSRDGKWVAENDPNAPYLVQSYDPKSHAITLNHENQSDQLTMERLSPTPEVMAISGAPVAVAEDAEQATRSRRPRTAPSPRRAPPPPPQWLIERRQQQQQEREARGESSMPPSGPPPGAPPSGRPPTLPPDFIPNPPPNLQPPPPPGE